MEEAAPIIDSALSLDKALAGLEIPHEIKQTLTIIDVHYFSFDGLQHQGQIVLHKDVAQEVKEIFKKISDLRFPIQLAIPIVHYDWNDAASMRNNNTSGFNYRVIYATDVLSNHSYGLAIDVNPGINPQILLDGSTLPANTSYDPSVPGAITSEHEIVALFLANGWEWGGHWEIPDWQHFSKKL